VHSFVSKIAKKVYKCLKKARRYDDCSFSIELKSIASSLTSTFEKKYSSRYDFIELPSYREIAVPVQRACDEILRNDSSFDASEERAFEIQGVLVICLQVLVAPMRGKPFWDNVLSVSKLSSMPLNL